MKTFFHRLTAWFIAAIITAVLGSLFSTLRILASLKNIGAPIDGSSIISMASYDIWHFSGIYGVFIAIAFLIAFLAAKLLHKKVGHSRSIIYISAGTIAMAVMLWLMQKVFFGDPLIGGTRDAFGLVLQLFAGAVGGFSFAKLRLLKTTA
ncbi:MAG: hypothetical protein ACPGVT_07315 [Maricaulaceae bacterium]